MRNRNRQLLKIVSATALALSVLAATGCSDGGVTPPQTDASEQQAAQGYDTFEPREGNGVDVVYFEEEGACDCMAEVGDAVEHSIRSNFAQELESGELRFLLIASDNAANADVVEMFNAQLFDLFIVEYSNGKGTATPVYEIWNFMGDDEAIELFVKTQVEAALAEQP